MTPNSPNSPREELEARLTALLLGELSAEEAAALRHAIAQDAELSRLHDRLKQAIGLVRETTASPAQEDLASPDAPTLSPERRAALLAAFKVIRPKELRKAQSTFIQREWLAVAAMIVILCLAGAIVSKNFVRARFASQKQYLYVARDERWAETATPTTPLARGDNGRVSVSGKPVNSPAVAGQRFFAEAQPQNDVTLTTILPTDGKAPEKTAVELSVNAAIDLAPSASISRLEPEMKSFSAVADALKQSSPAHLPLLSPPPPPPSEVSQSGERPARQFASIALPTVEADALATGSEDKKSGSAGQGLDAAKATSFWSDASGPRRSGSGGADRGGGGAGARPAEFAGVSLGGVPGGAGNMQPAVPPLSDSRSELFAYTVTPVPAPAGPVTDLGLKREQPPLAAAKDDGLQSTTGEVNLGALVTNGASIRDRLAVGDPMGRNNEWFGGVGQTANFFQRSDNFAAPTPRPDGLELLGDQNRPATPLVNSAADGFYRFRSVDPRADGMKDAPWAKEKLAEALTTEQLGRTALFFDAEGKNIVRDLQRNSGQKTDEKPPAKQSGAIVVARTNGERNVVQIALPESERGEAEEKLRIASGAVVISEIMANEPASRLPAQKQEDVALAVEEGDRRHIPSRPVRTPAPQLATVEKPGITDLELQQGFVAPTLEPETLRKLEATRIDAKAEYEKLNGVVKANESPADGKAMQSRQREELRRKLNSIQLDEISFDSIPLAQALDVIDRKARAQDPNKKGVNLIVSDANAALPAKPVIEPTTGLPTRPDEGNDLAGVAITINPPLRNITVGQALDAISKAADRPLNLSVENYAVVISDQSKNVENAQRGSAATSTSPRFDNTSLSQILDRYQELTGRTVLRPGSLPKTKITLRNAKPLTRGEEIQALDSILSMNGIAMTPQGTQFVKAVSEAQAGASAARFSDLPAEFLSESGSYVTHVVQLTNASPDAARAALQTLANAPNSILTIPSTGLLVIRDKAQNVDQMVEALKRLDSGQKEDAMLARRATTPIPQPEVATTDNAFSTFSLNVSDVSFKLTAASLEKGQMPDPATVRSEEFINAFDYRDPEPKGSAPIAFAWERARYPFAHDRDLMRFSVKTAASGRQPGRPLNLVLLLDNSGSMERADRIRIRQECLRVLASQLQPQDRVSVVAFARTARLWVDGLPGNQAGELSQRVGTLAPEGGTNLEDAMNVAYKTALRHFLPNGVNRVVLLTDGAANLGDVEPESLKKKVEGHRKQGVALDCFGIGWDGLNDELLEALSRNGDGRYGFVNTPEAASSEFAGQLAGALKVAASDVKVQVQWNPRRVTAYRQIGYAKHQLKKEQFRDNTVDAAEIGAAEAGNALYTAQVNPHGEGPVATVRVRFKVSGTGDYREHEWTVPYEGGAKSLDSSSPALRLAASASAFSEWLVSSPFAAEVTPDKLLAQLSGVPETWPADPRPKKLEWMIRQAKSVAGK